MSELKTKENDASVADFLNAVADETRRADAWRVARLMEEAAGEPPRMWGDSIVGFGRYHYKYVSGREGDMPLIGFSPRKASLSLYVLTGSDQEAALLARLGKHTAGKSCLYVKRLSDVDEAALRDLMRESVARMRALD